MNLLRTSLFLALSSFALTSCLDGPGLFVQDGDASNEYLMVGSETDGVTTGAFDPSNSNTQVLAASGNSAIYGASVAFPPGALSIDTEISIQQGASIATSGLSSALGIGTGVASAGPSVVVSAGLQIDASVPFTVTVPQSGASLALADSNEKIIVVYKVQRADGSLRVGLIPRDKLKFGALGVSFQTKHFGSFQLAETDELITEAKEAETDTPILTAADEKKLEPISWSLSSVKFDEATRTIKVTVSAKGFALLKQCYADVLSNGTLVKQYASVDPEVLEGVSGNGYTHLHKVKTDDAISLQFNLGCIDELGREEWTLSPKKSIPKKEVESTDDPDHTQTGPLGYTGVAADPEYQNRIWPSSLGNSITLTGFCDPNGGTISIRVDGHQLAAPPANADASISCPSSGDFSFTVGRNTSQVSDTVSVNNHDAGYGIHIHQNGFEAITTVFKTDSTVTPVSSSTGLAGVSTSDPNAFYVLTQDIDLGGSNWTPITGFSGVLDGDGHVIRNLTLNATSSSQVGLFAQINGGGHVAHLGFLNPTISDISGSTQANTVGVLAGQVTAPNTSPGSYITEVHVSNANITLDDTAGSTWDVGGLIGYTSNSHIQGSYFNGVIYAPASDRVGGILGSSSSMLFRSGADGDVTGIYKVGGLVGYALAGAAATGGYYFGDLHSIWYTGIVEGTTHSGNISMTGGIVGNLQSSSIYAAAVTTEIRATNISSAYGGIVGYSNAGKVMASYAIVDFTGNDYGSAGGLVGYTTGTAIIKDSYADTFFNITGSSHTNCGGLVGENNIINTSSFRNLFAVVDFTSTCIASNGGVVGYQYAALTANNVRFVELSSTSALCDYYGYITSCTQEIDTSAFDDAADDFYASSTFPLQSTNGGPFEFVSGFSLPVFHWAAFN